MNATPDVGGPILDGFAWVIIDLQPNTQYEVEVAVTDGSNSVTKTLLHSTRGLPPAAGAVTINIPAGASASQIQAAINGAATGAVIQFADGTYDLGTAQIDITSGTPKYIRGQSRTGVVIRKSSGGSVFRLVANSTDIVFENFTIQGPGVDGGISNLCVAFGQYSEASATRLTIRNVTAAGIDTAAAMWNVSQGLVYDSVFIGNNEWKTSPLNFLGSNLTWNDDGINIPGLGNCIFNNTMSGFGDTFSCAQHSGGIGYSDTRGYHVYRNDVRNGCDDAFEVDYGRRNITFYDNRFHNVMNTQSLDPLFGGPFISARNVFINLYRARPYKWNSENSGQFVYNNTIVTTQAVESATWFWYQPNNGDQRSYGFRNNIHVNKSPSASFSIVLWLESLGHNPIDWTHNSWYPDKQFRWNTDAYYNSLAEAQAGLRATTPIFSGSSRRMQNDNIVTSNPWTTAVTLGATSATEVTATYTPVLGAGNAKNTGVVIPNITDGYSGTAPDRGALIEGRPIPRYGDRT
jgi:hypothetical protein